MSSINPVVIRFVTEGVHDIGRALRGISDVVAQTDRASTSAARTGASTRVRILTEEAQAKIQSVQRATAVETAARRAGAREAARAARADARAAAQIASERLREIDKVAAAERRAEASRLRAAAVKAGVKNLPHNEKAADGHATIAAKLDRDAQLAKAKDAEREAARRAAIRDRSASMAGKFAAKQSKDAEREEAKRTKGLEKEEARRLAIRERSASMAGRFAAKQTADELRERKKLEAQTKTEQAQTAKRRERFANTVLGAGGTAVRRAGNLTGRAARAVGGTLMNLGGGFSFTDAIKNQADLERESTGFVNAAENKTGLDAKTIKARAQAASVKTGTDASEILAGGRAFLSKTGNAQEALDNMQMFGEIAKGTDANVADVANAAGILRVQNKNLSPEKMKEMLLQVVRQGQLGSIEFGDLASSVGKITKSSASYAGDQGANQAKLLGLAQVAMATSGSPAEASTVVSNIASDAMKHNADVKATLGAGAFNDRGQIAKAPEEFIADVMAKTGGNLQKIQAMGFGARSMKMFQALAPTFNEARDNGQSGRDAVLRQMKDATATPMKYDELKSNVAKTLDTSAEKFNALVRTISMEAGDKLLPSFVRLGAVVQEGIPAFAYLLDKVVAVAEWAASNPFEGFAGLVTTFFLAELAKAKIAETIKGIITGGGGGGGGGVPGAPAPPAGASIGALGLIGLIAAGGAAQVEVLAGTADTMLKGYTGGGEEAAKLTKLAKSGDVAGAQAGLDAAKGNSSVTDKIWALINTAGRDASYLTGSGAVGRVAGDYITEKVTGKGPADLEQIQQTIHAERVATDRELMEAIRENTRATRENSKNTPPGDGGPGGPADPGAPGRNRPIGAPGRY